MLDFNDHRPSTAADSLSVSTETITVLRTFGGLLATKVVTYDAATGKPDISDYGNAKYYTATEYEVSSIFDAAKLADYLKDRWQELVVRGEIVEGTNRAKMLRRLVPQPNLETGEIEPATLRSVPRRLLILDLDDIPCPPDIDCITDPEAAVHYAVSLLPAAFHGVSTRWMCTTGHGIKRQADGTWEIRLRLLYWLDRSLRTDELKAWLGGVTQPNGKRLVDCSVFGANQPNYLAYPIFRGMKDPLPRRSGLLLGDRDEVPVPEIDLSVTWRASSTGGTTPGTPGLGYEGHRARIGRDGFHDPMMAAVSAYIARHGSEVDTAWMQADITKVLRDQCRDDGHFRKHADKLPGLVERIRRLEAHKEAGREANAPFAEAPVEQAEESAMPYDFRQHLNGVGYEEGDACEEHDTDLDDPLFPADPGPLNPDTAPPEEYLVGKRLAVSCTSLLVAPGGVMKTTLQLLQAVAAVTGRNLTGDQVHKKCIVWFVSNEEPIEVLRRRLWAICLHHGIDYEQEVRGRLFVNSMVNQETAFEVARMESGAVVVSPDVNKVIRFAKKAGINLMFVDPFISTVAGISENDNSSISFAARQFARIATVVPLALELAHHVAKSEDPEAHVGNVARARGAGSIVTTVRYTYTVARTNDETAKTYNLSQEQRRRLIRFDMGDKNNYVLGGGEPRWFWLDSVELPNAKDGREASEVGVPMLYNMDRQATCVDPAKENRNRRIRGLLMVNVPEDTGSITMPQFLEVVRAAVNESNPPFMDATSTNSIRDAIEEAIPEFSASFVEQTPAGTIRLFRRKSNPNRTNATILLHKEITRS